MVPGAAVVAGPGGGIALCAGIGRARKNEGALSGLQLQQAFVSGAGIFHAIYIVSGAMVDGGAVIKAVDGVERHGLVRAKEDGGFIHVIPEAGGAHGDKIFVEAAPPRARACESEIGENAITGPNGADKNRAVGILDET